MMELIEKAIHKANELKVMADTVNELNQLITMTENGEVLFTRYKT